MSKRLKPNGLPQNLYLTHFGHGIMKDSLSKDEQFLVEDFMITCRTEKLGSDKTAEVITKFEQLLN